jgi:citrate lyase subunit beta / citryl-CoA lyase
MPVVPIRTWLFAPGSDERKTAKAIAGAADAVILDLEDAVAVAEKPLARQMVRDVLFGVEPDRNVWVRVNDLSTGMTADDLAAVCVGGLAGIVLPKAESGEMIRLASTMIDSYGGAGGVPEGQIRLAAIAETARGLLHLEDIAAGGGRLAYLMFGAGDLTNDIGIPTSNTGPHIQHGRIQTVLACRAHQLGAVDTAYFDVADVEAFSGDCADSKGLGFTGRGLIHPDQIAVANTAYSPSEAEVAAAKRMVDSFAEAERQGVAAIRVDGKLVDYAMVKNARQVLDLARTLAGRR